MQGLAFLAEALPQVPLPPDDADATGGCWSRPATRPARASATGWRRRSRGRSRRGRAADALIAQSEAQRAVFWGVREAIPEANRRIGAISSHDISLPPSRLAEFIARGAPAVAALDPELRINCFGHLGDGNLHYNVFPPRGRRRADYEGLRGAVKETVHELVARARRLGRRRARGRAAEDRRPGALRRSRASSRRCGRSSGRSIPLGILNPGAVLA